jgi:hypothetical protein
MDEEGENNPPPAKYPQKRTRKDVCPFPWLTVLFVPCSRSFLSLICVQRRQVLSLVAFTTFFREIFACKVRKIMKDLWMLLLVMATTVSTAQSWAPLKGFTRTTRSLSMMGQATYNGAIAETPSHHSFPYLKSLEERVNRLSSEESDCMVTS